jgi:hypothetical protein
MLMVMAPVLLRPLVGFSASRADEEGVEGGCSA